LSVGAPHIEVPAREGASPVAQVRSRLASHPLVLALGVYLVIDLAYFGARVIPHIGQTCACQAGADPTSYIWFLAWWPHALLHGINPFVTNVLFAPGKTNLGAVDVVPGAAILASPITLLFGPFVTYNVLALAAPLLAAFFAFLLCRYVTGSTPASLVGGYIYGFSPYMLGHLEGHLDLVMIFPIPAAVLLVLALIDGRISRRAFVPLMATALAFLLLSQPELTLTFVLIGACAFVVALVLLSDARARISAAVVPVLTAGVLAALVTSIFIYYALTGPVSSGFFAGYSTTYVADAMGFVVPTPVVRLGRTWFSTVSGTFTGGLPENGVYIGAVLLLALARHVITRWKSAATRFLLVMLALVVVLMLGPRLRIDGQPTISLPWNWFDGLPLLKHVAPVRLGVYMFLIVALIVAIWLSQTRAGRLGVAKWVVAAAALVTLVPNLGSDLWHSHLENPALFRTSAYRSVIRPGSIVLALPFPTSGYSMLWHAETKFDFRMAGGYVGAFQPPGYARDLGVLANPQIPPRARPLAAFLAKRHVSMVLVDANVPWGWPQALAALGLHPRLVGGVYVYALPGSVTAPGGHQRGASDSRHRLRARPQPASTLRFSSPARAPTSMPRITPSTGPLTSIPSIRPRSTSIA
jgi:hypothetical protein